MQNDLTAEMIVKIWKGDFVNEHEYSAYYVTDTTAKEGISVYFDDITVKEVIRINNSGSHVLAVTFNNCNINAIRIENARIGTINIDGGTLNHLILSHKANSRWININGKVSCLSLWDGAVVDGILLENCPYARVDISDDENEHTICKNLLIICSNIDVIGITGGNVDYIQIKCSKINHFELDVNSNIRIIEIIDNSEIKTLEIKSTNITRSLTLLSSKIHRILLNPISLPEITILKCDIHTFTNNSTSSSIFILKESNVDILSMNEIKTNKDGFYQIIDSKISRLSFNSVLNLAGFNIINLAPLVIENSPSIIEIIHSDLGKMMISSDLSKFNKIVFLNSRIVDIFIAGPELPDVFTTGNDILMQRRIVYAQLKKVYENRGDSISSLKYSKKEMEAYTQQKKSKSENIQLLFNSYTNSHGTEWTRPLLIGFIWSLVLYVGYCWLLFGFNFKGNVHQAFNLIPYYFEFINPAHKTNFVNDFNFKSNTTRATLALALDVISRLTIPTSNISNGTSIQKICKK